MISESCYFLQLPGYLPDMHSDIAGHSYMCSDVVWTLGTHFFTAFFGPFLFWYVYISYFGRLGECCICREECTVLADLTCQKIVENRRANAMSFLVKFLQSATQYSDETSIWHRLFNEDDDDVSFSPRDVSEDDDMLYPRFLYPRFKYPIRFLYHSVKDLTVEVVSLFSDNDNCWAARAGEIVLSLREFIYLTSSNDKSVKSLFHTGGHDNICRDCLGRCVQCQLDSDMIPPKCPVCRQGLYENDFMHLIPKNEQLLLRRLLRERVERAIWTTLLIGWPVTPPSFPTLWHLLSLSTTQILAVPGLRSVPISSVSSLSDSFPVDETFRGFQTVANDRRNHRRLANSSNLKRHHRRLYSPSNDRRRIDNQTNDSRVSSDRSSSVGRIVVNQRCFVNECQELLTWFGMKDFSPEALAISRQAVSHFPSLDMPNTVRHMLWAYTTLSSSDNVGRFDVADYLTTEYLREFAMPCPCCGVYVQRQSGCLHVVCFFCKTRFICSLSDDIFDTI
eukprot:GHVL01041235.1.p1 GENE.GHVL01041235.1~~GHVL01041235.1.p1  ORF type:complete len:506 (-),score=57.49 GHVL01041235.1:1945-3462(-)